MTPPIFLAIQTYFDSSEGRTLSIINVPSVFLTDFQNYDQKHVIGDLFSQSESLKNLKIDLRNSWRVKSHCSSPFSFRIVMNLTRNITLFIVQILFHPCSTLIQPHFRLNFDLGSKTIEFGLGSIQADLVLWRNSGSKCEFLTNFNRVQPRFDLA